MSPSPHPSNNFFKNYCGYPGGYEVVSHCGFDLRFPDAWRHGASSHGLMGHLFIFVREMSIQVFGPFLKLGCSSFCC